MKGKSSKILIVLNQKASNKFDTLNSIKNFIQSETVRDPSPGAAPKSG